MKIATIDIGTNTVLLLIAEFDKSGILHPLHHEQRTPRIGKNIDKNGFIEQEAFRKSTDIINEYKTIAEKFITDKIIATGTSALRDAKNKMDFINFIKLKTDIEIEVIEGEEEAKWSYRGAISGIDRTNYNLKNKQYYSVIDIGGGSTEIIIGDGEHILNKVSLNIGSVRITERFFKHNPPSDFEISSAGRLIEMEFSKLGIPDLFNSQLIGVAGTITTLAAYHQNLPYFSIEKISGYKLKFEDISLLFNQLKSKTIEEIGQIPSILKGREDVITAGNLILLLFMKTFFFEEITTSERGLRYGIAIRQWEQSS
jgi:exopolyphosphatase/guanosine-5'-triphosphate,3'-diphosphate pyrophosphatase